MRHSKQSSADSQAANNGSRVGALGRDGGSSSFRANRRSRTLFCLCLVAIAGLIGAVGSAQAAVTHAYSFSFNVANPSPQHIALNQSTGDVYVETSNSSTGYGLTAVNRYDADGTPLNYSAIGDSQLDGCCAFNGEADTDPGNTIGEGSFAIDNSPGSTKGYIFAAGGQVFAPTGQYYGQIVGTSSDNPGQTGSACGLAIDPLGGLYWVHPQVGSAALPQDASFIDKFIPGSLDRPEDWEPISTLYAGETESCNVVADASGALYNNKSKSTQRRPLLKYEPNLFDLLPEDPFSNSNCGCRGVTGKQIDPLVTRFTVDPSNGDVYANRRNQIAHYDSEGNLIETFGSGDFSLGTGVGVNEASGMVYVADIATNSVKVYKPLVTPDITDVSAAAGQTSATVSADIAPDGTPSVTSCDVEYGTTISYGASVPCAPGVPYSSATGITAGIPGLTAETVYHYRVNAGNSNGVHRGIDHTFMTHAVADTTTEEPSEITQFEATLNGSFTGNGENTHYYFEWGEDTSYGNATPDVNAGSASGKQLATAALTGLEIYTPTGGVYHYRLVTTNSVGTSYGDDLEFHTAPPLLPVIRSTSSSGIATSAATLESTVNPGLGDTVVIFEYGPSTEYGLQTYGGDSIGNDDLDHSVSESISKLSPGTTYHFRAVASNFAGTIYGEDRTFNTPDRPKIDNTSMSGISTSGATLEAKVTPNFSPTTFHFEYGPTGYTTATPESAPIGADNIAHSVSTAVSGLAAGTTYHFRVVATNGIGTVAGPDMTFTTATPASVPKSLRCKKGFVKRKGKCVRKKKSRKQRSHKHRHGNHSHG